MQLLYETYKDKVMGCWAGKNIGGVLGAPFECKRQLNDVEFYTQDLSKGPPPNDDLDLQIVWLSAVERFGRNVNASILGEYWLSFVIPHWVEYGTGKANLGAGLLPPLSGHFMNRYRDSCGCFIRSEIWACLAPGHPEIAVRYAYEDAIVDHSGEGVYGEIFCAAFQSAAFVENNALKLIDIGLSYIPKDCVVAKCINTAIECFEQKMDLAEARKRIHNTAPGTFGLIGKKHTASMQDAEFTVGTPGFDCPENIGYTIAGLLYGEGDFGKALCAAVNCGEDTDCSAATLGAMLGIIAGASNLPEKWVQPLDDKIATMCINFTSWNGVWIPKTVTELTERIMKVTPRFLDINDFQISGNNGYDINCIDGDDLYCPKDDDLPGHYTQLTRRSLHVTELVGLSPFVLRYEFPIFLLTMDYGDDIYFTSQEPRRLKLTLINNNTMLQQLWCAIKIYTPENVNIIGGDEYRFQLNYLHGDKSELNIYIDAAAYKGNQLELIVDIAFIGRHTNSQAKAIFLRKPN